jgi:predicted metal-dependent hydrolase
MPLINIGDRIIDYSVKYTRRQTIQLKLINLKNLEVTAPLRTPQQQILQIIQAKMKWLTKQVARLTALADTEVNTEIRNGATALYLGHRIRIVSATDSSHHSVNLRDNILTITTSTRDSDGAAHQLLQTWYVRQATALLQAQTAVWSAKIGVRPKRITVKDQKTRWGSCSALGNINYNWRIIMAPLQVVDYLIVHELCHLLVPNHSAYFWAAVATYLPDFKKHQAWLKDNGPLLMRFLTTNGDS